MTDLRMPDLNALDLLRELRHRGRGYHVLEAACGADALLITATWAQPIALMITDVVMPDMSGPELAKRLRLTRPDMRVLFISGHTDHAVVRYGVVDRAAFLHKPFEASALARKAREVLQARD